MNNPTLTLPAPIGSELDGGIYVGPHFEGNQVRHLIAAHTSLGDREREAAVAAPSGLRIDGRDDWFLPSKNQMMSALMHAQECFEKKVHWTATPYGSYGAWAVDFEHGDVRINLRSNEFRVRPFRIHQFSPSSLSPAGLDRKTITNSLEEVGRLVNQCRVLFDRIRTLEGGDAFDFADIGFDITTKTDDEVARLIERLEDDDAAEARHG